MAARTKKKRSGTERVEGFRRRERERIARVAAGTEPVEPSEEDFWAESGASPYREAEELARRLHRGR